MDCPANIAVGCVICLQGGTARKADALETELPALPLLDLADAAAATFDTGVAKSLHFFLPPPFFFEYVKLLPSLMGMGACGVRR